MRLAPFDSYCVNYMFETSRSSTVWFGLRSRHGVQQKLAPFDKMGFLYRLYEITQSNILPEMKTTLPCHGHEQAGFDYFVI